jgi:hypothetical protein
MDRSVRVFGVGEENRDLSWKMYVKGKVNKVLVGIEDYKEDD